MTKPVFIMPEFGQEADTYVAPVFNEDDVWIRNFQEGTHRVRLLQEPAKFVTYRQHYDGGIKKTFPCTEDTATCLGCTSDNERTRKRPRQYAFNALDSEGTVRLYRVGVGVKEDMESEANDRKDEGKDPSLTGVDMIIKRTGKTMDDTKYRVKLGDEYPVDVREDMYNIKQILATHYLQALEASGIDIESLMEGGTDTAHEAPVTDIKSKAATKKPSQVAAKKEPVTGDVVISMDTIEECSLSQLKAFLTGKDIEFPERGTRTVIEGLVVQALAPF